MRTEITCVEQTKGELTFYLDHGPERYFLFLQPYKRGVRDFYGCGVFLDQALDRTRARRDTGILHTMTKLPMYIRYIEKEYGLKILSGGGCRRPVLRRTA